ncbi:MAG TPA: sterol desaturase family protein [Xanthomonadaceae bacterium]|nr:sterol desaturase family protein [Xanthomonadaceae bacterium]
MAVIEVIGIGIVIYAATLARYFLFAGGAYGFFWVWKKHRFQHRRIQQRAPDAGRIRSEIHYSLLTGLIIALTVMMILYATLNGWTRIYVNLSDYGAAYFFFSIALQLVLHDAYFYWTHRLMHLKGLFKLAHRVHHFSISPSPWAAYSFHPLEAIVQVAILPVFAFTIPLHYAALFIFITYNLGNNVLGHLGYELFPKGFINHVIFKWHTTSTHHNMHHEKFNCNYSLYFRWWDLLMGTTHPDYAKRFREITKKQSVG